MPQEGDVTSYYKKIFRGANYQEKQIDEREFDNCQFINCTFNNAAFTNCRFDNCIFDNCDLSLISVKRSSFYKVEFRQCKAIGIRWDESSNPFDASFVGSILNYSSFAGKNLKKNKVTDCNAEEVDFSDANLSQANFCGTNLLHATFNNTDLTQANFTTATNYNISPQINKIKKAKFSMPEAMSFLHHLEIVVVE